MSIAARKGSPIGPTSTSPARIVLARVVHTTSSGGQWQAQLYYDGTYRNVPRQFSEHRDTADIDLQYRFANIPHHDVTAGAGLDLTRSATGRPRSFSSRRPP